MNLFLIYHKVLQILMVLIIILNVYESILYIFIYSIFQLNW